MSDIFDEIFNIPEGLILTEKQRKNLDNLDIFSRFLKIKSYKAQQGLDKKKEDPHYGDATAKELDNYMKNYQNPEGKVRSGVVAPVKDLWRNFNKMNDLKLETSDSFFHCKAHYEAASRGEYGSAISTIGGYLKEAKDIFKYPIDDCRRDLRANARGRKGAKLGKTLQETCPMHYKKY